MNLRLITAIACGVVFLQTSLSADMMPGPGIVGTIAGGGVSVVQVYADNGDGVFDAADVVMQSKNTDAEGKFSFDNLDMEHAYFVMHEGQVSPLQRIGEIKSYIDSFDITQSITSDPTTGFRIDSASGPAGMILGGFRDFYVDVLSGTAEAKLRSNPYSLSSALQIDMSAGVSGMATVTWDGVKGGIEPSAGLDVDFTNGGMYHGISLGLAVDQAGKGQMLRLLMHSPDGVSEAEVEFPVTPRVSPAKMTYVPFSDFIGDADPTAVAAFQMIVDETKPSLDARISDIGLTGANLVSFPVVPEPSSGLLLILGSLLFGGQLRIRFR